MCHVCTVGLCMGACVCDMNACAACDDACVNYTL